MAGVDGLILTNDYVPNFLWVVRNVEDKRGKFHSLGLHSHTIYCPPKKITLVWTYPPTRVGLGIDDQRVKFRIFSTFLKRYHCYVRQSYQSSRRWSPRVTFGRID